MNSTQYGLRVTSLVSGTERIIWLQSKEELDLLLDALTYQSWYPSQPVQRDTKTGVIDTYS